MQPPVRRSGTANRHKAPSRHARRRIVVAMFMVTESGADAIRAVYQQDGELSAAIEMRRRFPGIIDNARAIAGWTPLPAPPAKVVKLRSHRKAS